MYHALSGGPHPDHYVLEADRFRAQMEQVAGMGLRGVSVADFLGGAADRVVVVTFDDGNPSDRERALPVLRELGFTATFFVTTGRVGMPEGPAWGDLGQLLAAGMDVGAHGHTHAFLDVPSPEFLAHELETPRRLCQRHLGHEVRHLSLPGGRFVPLTLEAARRAGYASACTSRPGLNRVAPGAGFHVFGRYVMHQGVNDRAFARCVAGDPGHAARAARRYRLKAGLRRALGNRLYQRLWEAVRRG